MVVMGLMHLETLDPKLVGDRDWAAFVQAQVAALIGLPRPAGAR